jgi:hypothetical protein
MEGSFGGWGFGLAPSKDQRQSATDKLLSKEWDMKHESDGKVRMTALKAIESGPAMAGSERRVLRSPLHVFGIPGREKSLHGSQLCTHNFHFTSNCLKIDLRA